MSKSNRKNKRAPKMASPEQIETLRRLFKLECQKGSFPLCEIGPDVPF